MYLIYITTYFLVNVLGAFIPESMVEGPNYVMNGDNQPFRYDDKDICNHVKEHIRAALVEGEVMKHRVPEEAIRVELECKPEEQGI